MAKHKSIGCQTLPPDNPEQVGFSIGNMWYGVIQKWPRIRLIAHFELGDSPKPVINWFIKELFTTYADETKEGCMLLEVKFKKPRNIEIEGTEYSLIGISCRADREYIKKKKWVSWSGKAVFDWNANQLTIPPNGQIVGSTIDPDLRNWEEFDDELPQLEAKSGAISLQHVIYNQQQWDASKDEDVPNLDWNTHNGEPPPPELSTACCFPAQIVSPERISTNRTRALTIVEEARISNHIINNTDDAT